MNISQNVVGGGALEAPGRPHSDVIWLIHIVNKVTLITSLSHSLVVGCKGQSSLDFLDVLDKSSSLVFYCRGILNIQSPLERNVGLNMHRYVNVNKRWYNNVQIRQCK